MLADLLAGRCRASRERTPFGRKLAFSLALQQSGLTPPKLSDILRTERIRGID
ncbi:MAG: hypothetical protein JRE16_10610 [Deltaproteobacteria bacterium]|nr:hypothetical protein [Deltaproteobacteria bacterium]